MDEETSINSDKTDACEVLEFELNGRTLAVSPDDLLEIVEETQYVPVPKSPSFLKGIMNSHGRVVSVIDFAGLLGFKDAGIGGELRIAILKDEDHMIGLTIPADIRIRVCEGTKTLMGGSQGIPFFRTYRFVSKSASRTADVLNCEAVYDYLIGYFKNAAMRSV